MASSALSHYAPSRGLASTPLWRLQEEMGRLFDETFRSFGSLGLPPMAGNLPSMPRIDVQETEHELRISAELPGVQAADLDVRLNDDVLTISGEKRSSRDDVDDSGMHVSERSYGRFSRSMQLPFAPKSEADIKADFKDGVLTLHMPKQANARQSRRIPISQGDGEAARAIPTEQAATGAASESQEVQETSAER